MIEEQARVVAIHDGIAEVVAERRSSCGSCSAKSGCGTSLLASWLPNRRLIFRARNDIGAKVGDAVVIGLEEARLQKGSLLLYALPLSGLLIGAVGGEQLFSSFGLQAELGSVLFGLLGLIVAFVAVKRFSASAEWRDDAAVKLLRVSHQTIAVSQTNIGLRKA